MLQKLILHGADHLCCDTYRVALALTAVKHAVLVTQEDAAHAHHDLNPLLSESTESLVAALLFTAHPIHTEAVAGVVGHAELVGAALGLGALLAYISAAKQSVNRQHYLQLMTAVVLLWTAALAKEIGITMVSYRTHV